MCKWCMTHGDGKKWYLNAKNYLVDELADELNLKDYLTEQWRYFEQVYIRRVMGFSSQGLGYKLKLPIIGKIIRNKLEKMIHSEKKNRKANRADGHFGQIIPLEDAKVIIEKFAAEPIIENYCMCRWMQRGIKDRCCINFGLLSEVIEKLPRFIPDNIKSPRISREEAIERLEKHNKDGYISSVWFQPVPYINAICSCESPECGGLRIRSNFDLDLIYKAEYIIQLNQDNCQGCKKCVSMCQFDALRYIPSIKRVIQFPDKCFGCGLCRHACEHEALKLVPRDEVPGQKGKY